MALTAGHDIRHTQVIDHVDPGERRQLLRVADLHGELLGRPVQHGLAMKGKQINIACRPARFHQQTPDRLGVSLDRGSGFVHGTVLRLEEAN